MKNWKAGVADTAWKVMVCARDAEQAERILTGLMDILTDAGGDQKKGVELLSAMSGKDIVAGLLSYIEKSRESVENALNKAE